MTYADWRRFGYVSRLSEIHCKAGDTAINTGRSITGQQLGVASDAGSKAQADYTQFKTTLAPFVQQQMALASGDKQAALEAAMPVISKLSAGWNGAKQSILNTMPAGAARDRALADSNTQMFTNIAGAQAGMVHNAPQALATTVAPLLDQNFLQEMGAQLSGLQGGASSNAQTGQMEIQRNAAMLNFFGQLAGAAGGMFTFGGGGRGGCWIAEAVYGKQDVRTVLVRAYLNGPFCRTRAGRSVMTIYRLIGRQVAWLVRRSGLLRAVFKPLFDRALRRALATS